MAEFDYSEIPDNLLHDAVTQVLGNQMLIGGHHGKPYNFRCPLCEDSLSNPNHRKGYILHDGGRWTYLCFRKCGTMSFMSFLKTWHPEVHRTVCFNGLRYPTRKRRKIDDRTEAEKTYKASTLYNFKKGELVSLYDENPTSKTALEYCISRQIPEKIYSRWFVCIKDAKFYNTNPDGSYIYNEKNMPTGNEYGNRLIIPYYRYGGSWVQFDARALDENAFLRYRNLENAERELYNIDWLDTSKPFFLLEGSIDSTFIKNSCAFGGTKHLKRFLEMYPHIFENRNRGVVIWDNDDAGRDELIATIKMGFHWLDWSDIQPLPEYKYKEDGSLRELKDINDVIRFSDAFETDDDGFVTFKSLKKYIKKADGGILATMMYGDREKLRKEKFKKFFDEAKQKNKVKPINLLLG